MQQFPWTILKWLFNGVSDVNSLETGLVYKVFWSEDAEESPGDVM